MLELTNPRWEELAHAHGNAADIPPLLEQLRSAVAPQDPESEPWSTLWKTLCQDNRVFTASYAAVPHIVEIASSQPLTERLAHLHFVSMIEALRHRKEAPGLPADLAVDYLSSIQRAVSLMLPCFGSDWNGDAYRATLGGLSALLGHPELGMSIFEFTSECECPRCGNVFPPKGYDLFVEPLAPLLQVRSPH